MGEDFHFQADNKMLLSVGTGTTLQNFGPFDPVCSADKFALIHSGDSVEVFSFLGTSPPIAYDVFKQD